MLVKRGLQQQSVKKPSSSSSTRRPRVAAVAVRAVVEPATRPAAPDADRPASSGAPSAKLGSSSGSGKEPEHFINVIPRTAWDKGIPPVMVRGIGWMKGGGWISRTRNARRRSALRQQ